MKEEKRFREPTELERLLFARLLEANFSGRDGLAPLLHHVLVKTIDEDGGLEIQSQAEGKASVMQRVPVEAEAIDEDGSVIHMLLHVAHGRPIELEFFREDAETVKKIPPASTFQLIVLPRIPEEG